MSVSSFFRSFFGENDLVWVTTPTGWSVLLLMTFFNNWSVGAGAFVHYKKVTARETLETLQEYPITKAQFRPSVYMRALDESDLKSFRFPSLKLCFRRRRTIEQTNVASMERTNGSGTLGLLWTN